MLFRSPTTLEVRPGSADQIQQPPQQEQQEQQNQGKPGWLGLSGTAITPEIAQAMGLPPDTKGYLVLEIVADGPADKGGIRGGYKIDNVNGREIALGGDIIVGIDNTTVTTPENVVTSLKEKQAGDTVQLGILRDGQSNRVELTLGEIPQAALQGRQGEGQQPQLDIIP